MRVVGGEADGARLAEGEGEEDRVAGFGHGDAGADGAHVAGAFVAEDSWVEGDRCCAVGEAADEDVGMADALGAVSSGAICLGNTLDLPTRPSRRAVHPRQAASR